MGGATDSYGDTVTEPAALIRARLVVGLCERFSCLPSALLEEDAELFQMLTLVRLGEGEHE